MVRPLFVVKIICQDFAKNKKLFSKIALYSTICVGSSPILRTPKKPSEMPQIQASGGFIFSKFGKILITYLCGL